MLQAGGTATAAKPVSSGTVVLRQTLTPPDNSAAASLVLRCLGLPALFIWLQQSTGATGATIQVQFAVAGSGANTDEWLSLGAPFILNPVVGSASGAPTMLFYRMPAAAIRYTVTRAAGVSTIVQSVLGAAL